MMPGRMAQRRPMTIAAVCLAALVAAFSFGACGGDDETTGESSPAPKTQGSAPKPSGETPKEGKGQGMGSGERPAEKGSSADGDRADDADGGGSRNKDAEANEEDGSDYRGGEKSIEEFGSEAEGSDEEAIVSAEQAYLSAVADEDFGTACSYLSASVQSSLEQFVTPKLKAKGCPAILPKLLSSTAPAIARQQAEGEIKKVRIKGDQAFVIFHAPGAKLYVFTMVREQDGWKVTTLIASILVPSPATLGIE